MEGESEEDSEDLSDDDEDAEFVTPQVDAAILRTLARIKAKDPAVYVPDRDVFEGTPLLFDFPERSLVCCEGPSLIYCAFLGNRGREKNSCSRRI